MITIEGCYRPTLTGASIPVMITCDVNPDGVYTLVIAEKLNVLASIDILPSEWHGMCVNLDGLETRTYRVRSSEQAALYLSYSNLAFSYILNLFAYEPLADRLITSVTISQQNWLRLLEEISAEAESTAKVPF